MIASVLPGFQPNAPENGIRGIRYRIFPQNIPNNPRFASIRGSFFPSLISLWRVRREIFAASHRPDPHWPLDRLSDALTESRKQAWEITTERRKARWAPESSTPRPG
jgi:hypothetical protein